MPHPRFTGQEIGERGKEVYEKRLRALVETPENIGKLLSLDIETGDYVIADAPPVFASARKLQAKNPNAEIYTLRIGYNAVYALGGVVERVS